jgi:hypothetical protein
MSVVDRRLEDGRYDAIVTTAQTRDDAEEGALVLELAIVSGAHKGEVVALRTERATYDPIDLLALPCTLVVEEGAPRVEW